jgi:hypothetical protein
VERILPAADTQLSVNFIPLLETWALSVQPKSPRMERVISKLSPGHIHTYCFPKYCNVLGFLFTMELYCTPKVNTLQLNTVGNSWNTSTRPTCTSSEHSHVHDRPVLPRNTHSYRILPTGPLVAIFQHSLPYTPGQSVVGLSVHLHTTTALRRIVHH